MLFRSEWLALTLAASGLLVIGLHTDGSTTVLGLVLTLLAALSWACGNLTSRRSGSVNMVAYVVWSSLFAVPALLLLALMVEGWQPMQDALINATVSTWLVVGWQAWATPCSVTRPGAGCCHATTLRPSAQWPCWSPSLVWPPHTRTWASPCRRGRLAPPAW